MEMGGEQIDKWLFEFKLNGFVLFRNLFPASLIDQMNDQFAQLYQLERRAVEGDEDAGRRGPGRYVMNLGALAERFGGPLNDPRVRNHPIIEELAGRILGKWKHGRRLIECVERGSEFMGWHTDIYYETPPDRTAPKTTVKLLLQIPLVDVGESNGPTEVIPGSHHMHYFEGTAAVNRLPRIYSAKILTARGDCFLREADLIHRGTPNLTDQVRPLYTQIYKAVDEGG